MTNYLKMYLAFITLFFLTVAQAQSTDVNIKYNLVVDCGPKPNCVSTRATNPDRQIQLINFTGTLDEFKKYSQNAIKKMTRSKIVNESPNTISVEFTSLILRFTDDFDIEYIAASNSIHMRSASRLGYSDLGVNLKRTEQFRSLFLSQIPTE